MKPGAKMAILEMAVNDDRVTPTGTGRFAMSMLTTTPSGDAYSQREIASMCTDGQLAQRNPSLRSVHSADGYGSVN